MIEVLMRAGVLVASAIIEDRRRGMDVGLNGPDVHGPLNRDGLRRW
jgi:hypothetical protein